MIDYLGNQVDVGDTVIIAMKEGRTANFGRAFVKKKELRPQFREGAPTNMVEVEWSNVHRFWIPARRVIKIPDEMLPEKRREKLIESEEGIEVT